MAHFECGMNLEKIFQLFPLLWGISGAAATMFQEGFISHPLQITKLFLVQPTSGPFESETYSFHESAKLIYNLPTILQNFKKILQSYKIFVCMIILLIFNHQQPTTFNRYQFDTTNEKSH